MTLLDIIFLSLIVSSQCQIDYSGNLQVVSDLKPEDCFGMGKKYDHTGVLPTCSAFDEIEEGCLGYNTPDSAVMNKPSCTINGDFGPVQCKGQRTTGRCFCSDVTGNRIFGQQWWNQAEDMTCACSRKKADLANTDDTFYFNSLHCDSMGNYETLQCDVLSGICWCADIKTGELKSPVVPEQAMTKLPCYLSTQVGTQYLRQCESKKYAQQTIAYKLNMHGTNTHFQEFVCDDDGSFGAYAIIDGSAFCTWRDNTKIGSWQAGSNFTGIDCNCARDSKIFQLVGKTQAQQCASNGNYQEYQNLNSRSYCVDSDGYLKSPSDVHVEDPSECSLYDAYH